MRGAHATRAARRGRSCNTHALNGESRNDPRSSRITVITKLVITAEPRILSPLDPLSCLPLFFIVLRLRLPLELPRDERLRDTRFALRDECHFCAVTRDNPYYAARGKTPMVMYRYLLKGLLKA